MSVDTDEASEMTQPALNFTCLISQVWPYLRPFLTYEAITKLQQVSRDVDTWLRQPCVEKGFMFECLDRSCGFYTPPTVHQRSSLFRSAKLCHSSLLPRVDSWLAVNVKIDRQEALRCFNHFPQLLTANELPYELVDSSTLRSLVYKLRYLGAFWGSCSMGNGYAGTMDQPFISCCVYKRCKGAAPKHLVERLESLTLSALWPPEQTPSPVGGLAAVLQQNRKPPLEAVSSVFALDQEAIVSVLMLHAQRAHGNYGNCAPWLLRYLLYTDEVCDSLESDPLDKGGLLRSVREVSRTLDRAASVKQLGAQCELSSSYFVDIWEWRRWCANEMTLIPYEKFWDLNQSYYGSPRERKDDLDLNAALAVWFEGYVKNLCVRVETEVQKMIGCTDAIEKFVSNKTVFWRAGDYVIICAISDKMSTYPSDFFGILGANMRCAL